MGRSNPWGEKRPASPRAAEKRCPSAAPGANAAPGACGSGGRPQPKPPLRARELEERLRAYYRAERPEASPHAKDQVKTAVLHVLADEGAPAAPGILSFVAGQARFIRPTTWAAQAALLALAALSCLLEGALADGSALAPGACLFGGLSALAAIPDLTAAKACRMAELEYSCRFNGVAAAFARLAVLGAAGAVALAAATAMAPHLARCSAAAFALRACAPYFLALAGALRLARRARAESALPLGLAWAAFVAAGAAFACWRWPVLYGTASLGAWAAVAGAALAWCAVEARRWLAAIDGGLDVLIPTAEA